VRKSVNETQDVNRERHRAFFKCFALLAHSCASSILRSMFFTSPIYQLINDDQMTT
jgi:hypothetical protein